MVTRKPKPKSKSQKPPPSQSAPKKRQSAKTIRPTTPGASGVKDESARSTKQKTVLDLLRQSRGTTIDAVMKATDWRQHSVRGFFAGVVKKKLALNLTSEMVDGTRVYRIGKAGAV